MLVSPPKNNLIYSSPSSFSPIASIPFFACELKAVSPYRRGFICGDPSITYPYLDREAIPDELLITGGIIITGLTVSTHHLHYPCHISRPIFIHCIICNLVIPSLDRPRGVLPRAFPQRQL